MEKSKKRFAVYLNGKQAHDKVLKAFARGCDSEVYEQGRTLVGGITVLAGLEVESMSRIKQCQREKKPFIFIDHAYFDRGYQLGNMRVCVNGVHQSKLLDVPGGRSRVEVKPWRTGTDVVVIAPSERVCQVVGVSNRWAQDTAEQLKKYTSRPIRIRQKGSGFVGELANAHCVVTLASVAEVEAAVFGVPVFSSPYSPAAQIAEQDFSKIETPIYPDREPWLRTLSYSQWNVGEMAVGQTTRHLEGCYGDLDLCGASDSGK